MDRVVDVGEPLTAEKALQEIEKNIQPEKDCIVCAVNDDMPCGACMERARLAGMVASIRKRVLP